MIHAIMAEAVGVNFPCFHRVKVDLEYYHVAVGRASPVRRFGTAQIAPQIQNFIGVYSAEGCKEWAADNR
jgi:hypothetical protein